MGRRLVAFIVMLTAAVSVVLLSDVASAQQTNSASNGNGLRISPVRFDLTIEPGKSETISVYIENITDSPATLKAVVNDFTASSDESGNPRVLLNENDFAPSRGLKRYISKVDNVTLKPKERKVVAVRIAMPADAPGGGYFGAVRFLPANVAAESNVSLSASVGSLILVKVPGDITEQVSVSSMNVSRGSGKASSFFTSGKDLKTTVRFRNSGNVQTAPFGKVFLKKGGKELASIEINNTQPRSTVLPDSVRRFEVGLQDKATGFGKYTVEGSFGYGDQGQLIQASSTFYVVPLPIVILAVTLVTAIILGIFVIPRLLKAHDRKLIRKIRGKK